MQKRADVKREEGNEAFKEGNWAQAVRARAGARAALLVAPHLPRLERLPTPQPASSRQAVFYTQAISIKPSATLHSNRSAAFLKLGEHEKARRTQHRDDAHKAERLPLPGRSRADW